MIFKYAMRRNVVKMQGEKSASFSLARGRLILLSAFFVLVYSILALRAFDLAVIQAKPHVSPSLEMAQSSKSDVSLAGGLRASIVDRNGVMLATTLEMASLYADPRYISDPVLASKALSKIFPDLPYGQILEKLQSSKKFVWVKRNIMPAEQEAVLRIGEPGLGFRYEDRRIYPHGGLMSHFTGYTNVDGLGLAGVERSFDNLLSDGKVLDLSLDVRLQHALHRELSRSIKEFSAAGGAGIIMDVNNGEILAGVSLPDFDPHVPGKTKPEQIFNRMTLGVYELGSVFKIFSTAALFETLNIPMSTTFDAREPIKRGRFTINDYHAEDRVLTVPEVFMYSSNIGSAMMGEAVGSEALQNFYRDLGLLDTLDFEINEVTAPIIPRPWGEVSTLTASYGHGIATTPMQLISAVSSVVNGGYVVKPTLIKQVAMQEGAKIRVVSEDVSKKMRQLMRLTVSDGTGKKADVKGFFVGGKTGTAEKVSGGRKGYDRKRLISSFVGAFPMNDPKYAIYIVVDEPKGHKASFGYATAGWAAAPAFARVVKSMASILGMSPQDIAPSNDISAPLKHFVAAKEGR